MLTDEHLGDISECFVGIMLDKLHRGKDRRRRIAYEVLKFDLKVIKNGTFFELGRIRTATDTEYFLKTEQKEMELWGLDSDESRRIAEDFFNRYEHLSTVSTPNNTTVIQYDGDFREKFVELTTFLLSTYEL